jgi:hypothetical protein
MSCSLNFYISHPGHYTAHYTGHRAGRTRNERSNIHIAKRTGSCAQRILDQDALSIHTQINHIIQSGIPRWRAVIQCDGASQGVIAFRTATACRILILPDPPGTIDLRMMQPKPNITWGRENVRSRIAASPVSTISMFLI